MKFFLILIYFLREEIKLNFTRLKFIYSFFKEFSIFRFFLYLFNNSFNPSRDKIFRNYIYKNSQKWKNKNNSKNLDNKYLLIGSFIPNVVYAVSDTIIGKNLMEILNTNGIALMNNYDLKKKLLFKSFGIEKIIILKNLNLFVRLNYFIKAYLIIQSCKNIDEFLKFNINNVEIGKAVYDHYLRFSGIGTTNEFVPKFYVYLAKCLSIYDQFNKYLKKYKIVALVQTEKQFIPGSVVFQSALVNGINTYSRTGILNKFSIKKYSNVNERYTQRSRYSKKLFNAVVKNFGKEAIEAGGNIVKKRFEGKPGFQVFNEYYILPEFTKGKKIRKIDRKRITKEDLCKRLGWSLDSPIGVLFSSDLTDGVFDATWSVFRDRLTWLRESLDAITKINNMNWLVRPHPNDKLNNVITSTVSEYEKICSNYNHIKMFPEDVAPGSIPKLIDVSVTQSGTAASEYPCFGIPTIITSETLCSGLGYTIEPQSKEEYFFQLQNANTLEKLNDHQIELAKTYLFIQYELSRIPAKLIAPHETKYVNKKIFWTEMTQLLDQYKYEEDLLLQMMRIQEANNDVHTIDYRMLEKKI